MAIAIGATVSTMGDNSTPYASLSHTVDTDTTLLVVIVQGWSGYPASASVDKSVGRSNYAVDGASWDGTAMTALNLPSDVNNFTWMDTAGMWEVYVLADPDVKTANVTFGSGNVNFGEGGNFFAVNVIDADTSGGVSGVLTQFGEGANSTTCPIGPDTVAVDDLLIAGAHLYGTNTVLWDGASTSLSSRQQAGDEAGIAWKIATSTSETMTASNGPDMSGFMISITEDTGGGGGGPPVGQILTLGAGG